MPAPLKTWHVLPHDAPVAVEDNILTVVGEIEMPFGTVPRRMTVVRLKGGGLVVFSAIALDAAEMQALEDFGEPLFLVVPGDHHRLDARIWKDRYPGLRVIAPEGAREAVQKTVPVDATSADFGDPDVRFVTVPGTHGHEAALEISGPHGLTLVLNDLVANIRSASGFSGWLWRVMGFAGDAPAIPLPTRLAVIENKRALAAQLRRWAGEPALRRILVSHGDMITDDPAGVLRALAAKLD